jgi:hypothetical protein
MLQYSPKITTDGLVMCLDASQNKSYPTDLPVKNGLVMWMDAADDTTFSYSSGTEVSQWRDKSGNNFHANQSLSSAQPSRSTFNNSRKSVNFVAANAEYFLISATPNLALPGDASIFIVYKPATQSNVYAVLLDNYHGQGGNYGFVIQRVNNLSQFYYANADSSGFIDTAASPWTYTDNVIQLLSLNKLSTTGTPYISGTAQTSRSVRAATAQATTGLVIGTWGQGGRNYNGDMCEILIFNRSLDSTEMKKVHTYLGQKWGISNTDRSIVDLVGNNIGSFGGAAGSQTVANMPSFDVYNKGALRFDGTDDYVVGSVPSIAASSTVGMWIKSSNYDGKIPFSIAGATYGSGPNIFFYLNTINWNTGDGQGNSFSGSSYPDSNWHYIVVTNDAATNAKLYIDGVLIGTAAYRSTLSTNSNNLWLGRFGGDNNYTIKANIAAAQLYNKVLSAVEVAQNYEAQKSKFANTIVQQGLVLNLDAGNPYSYAGTGSDWFDVSGNNNTSLLVGTTLPTFSNTNGGILIYDGNTQYSRTPSPSNNFAWTPSGVGLNNMTIDLWIKTTDGSGTILSKPWSGNGEYNFGLGHQGFSIVIGNQTNTLGFSSILTGNWINLVIVVSPTQYGAYINGVQNTALTNHGITNNTPTYGNGQIELTLMTLYPYGGGGNAGFSTQGNIGSFRIYNRVLTAAEVLQNYNATKGRFGL